MRRAHSSGRQRGDEQDRKDQTRASRDRGRESSEDWDGLGAERSRPAPGRRTCIQCLGVTPGPVIEGVVFASPTRSLSCTRRAVDAFTKLTCRGAPVHRLTGGLPAPPCASPCSPAIARLSPGLRTAQRSHCEPPNEARCPIGAGSNRAPDCAEGAWMIGSSLGVGDLGDTYYTVAKVVTEVRACPRLR